MLREFQVFADDLGDMVVFLRIVREARLRGNRDLAYRSETTGPEVSRMSTSAVTDSPMRSGCARSSLGSSAIRTGKRWTILIQFPEAFWAGKSAKAVPLPAERPTTFPWYDTDPPYMSARSFTGWPTRISRS